jgi:hypothetical protein
MTPLEALERANACSRLAEVMPDPMKRRLLHQMRQIWIALATEGRQAGAIDAEIKEFLELEAAIVCRPDRVPFPENGGTH